LQCAENFCLKIEPTGQKDRQTYVEDFSQEISTGRQVQDAGADEGLFSNVHTLNVT